MGRAGSDRIGRLGGCEDWHWRGMHCASALKTDQPVCAAPGDARHAGAAMSPGRLATPPPTPGSTKPDARSPASPERNTSPGAPLPATVRVAELRLKQVGRDEAMHQKRFTSKRAGECDFVVLGQLAQGFAQGHGGGLFQLHFQLRLRPSGQVQQAIAAAEVY